MASFWMPQHRRENPAEFAAIATRRPNYNLDDVHPRLMIRPYRLGFTRNAQTGEKFPALLGGPRIRRRVDGRWVERGFFTQTSKMSCLSFSLPAGPERLGGTCPASVPSAIPADVRQKPASAQGFICGDCYAGKNRYLYGSMQKAQMLHYAWVERALADGVFAEEMFQAVLATYRAPRAALALAEIDPDFFRIHDSGDFYRKDYYTAWAEVCRAASAIQFWAPTRMWVFPDWREHMVADLPRNLALRPSALWFDARPPKVAGFSAGSGAGAAPGAWDCPAWGTGSCGTAKGPNGKVPCRTCWAGKTPVTYHKH